MSFNIRFNTKQAEQLSPSHAVSWDDTYLRQNVAGWEGVVCPNGYTMISDQPEVVEVLEAAGIPYEEC